MEQMNVPWFHLDLVVDENAGIAQSLTVRKNEDVDILKHRFDYNTADLKERVLQYKNIVKTVRVECVDSVTASKIVGTALYMLDKYVHRSGTRLSEMQKTECTASMLAALCVNIAGKQVGLCNGSPFGFSVLPFDRVVERDMDVLAHVDHTVHVAAVVDDAMEMWLRAKQQARCTPRSPALEKLIVELTAIAEYEWLFSTIDRVELALGCVAAAFDLVQLLTTPPGPWDPVGNPEGQEYFGIDRKYHAAWHARREDMLPTALVRVLVAAHDYYAQRGILDRLTYITDTLITHYCTQIHSIYAERDATFARIYNIFLEPMSSAVSVPATSLPAPPETPAAPDVAPRLPLPSTDVVPETPDAEHTRPPLPPQEAHSVSKHPVETADEARRRKERERKRKQRKRYKY
jgi:hypothetical protein